MRKSKSVEHLFWGGQNEDESLLSKEVYAEAEDLLNPNIFSMDNEYVENGAVTKKIVFGKNGSGGQGLEWCIAGKDPVNEGLVIMAAKIIRGWSTDGAANKRIWGKNRWGRFQAYDADAGWGNYETAPAEKVGLDHWGSSEMRSFFKQEETDVTYFSEAEQGLMKTTTIYTYDNFNKTVYSTDDKLYLANAKDDDTYVTVGSNTPELDGDLKIDLDNFEFENIETGVYLRAPRRRVVASDQYFYVLTISKNGYSQKVVGAVVSDTPHYVSPVVSVDVSDVYFASAVPEASSVGSGGGNISSNDALVLRWPAGDELSGVAATYTSKEVTVNAPADSALVVQYYDSDEDQDKYYIETFDSAVKGQVVAAESIADELDLTACKVWIETTNAETNMVYATKGKELISHVDITDIDAPASMLGLDTSASCASKGVAAISEVSWMPSDTAANFHTVYTASMTLTPEEAYAFVPSTTATVNGEEAAGITLNEDGTLTVTYQFPETASANLISITPPSAVTVPSGTAKTAAALGLPDTVAIVTEDITVTSAGVTWDLENLVSGSYDPDTLTEQTFETSGTVTLPEGIENGNQVSLTVTVSVTVLEAGTLQAPAANTASGTYADNKNVALSVSEDGADIYYTTDGTVPTRSSTKYTGKIPVTGTPGSTVTMTIKAFAVKDGMKDSPVVTFEYTINIPEDVHSVTVQSVGHGTASADVSTAVAGTNIALTAEPESGYQFKEWQVLSGSAVISNNSFIMPDSDVVVEAVFEKASEAEFPTENPPTKAPTTENPPTKAPTTENPPTKAPTTEKPATEAPTENQTTEIPATEAPTGTLPTKVPTENPATKTPAENLLNNESPTGTPPAGNVQEDKTEAGDGQNKGLENDKNAQGTASKTEGQSLVQKNPKTGDHAPDAVMLALLLTGAALAGISAYRKQTGSSKPKSESSTH